MERESMIIGECTPTPKKKQKKSVLGRRTSTTYVEEKCFNATKRKNIVCLRENVSILENYREVLQHNQENKL